MTIDVLGDAGNHSISRFGAGPVFPEYLVSNGLMENCFKIISGAGK